jgi:2-C-methyl-D-erythritol 4-phosphate cytidylyltransferase
MKSSRYFVLIPAAGVGARMGGSLPKQYMNLAEKPMLAHTISGFLTCLGVAHIFVVVNESDSWIDQLLPQYGNRVTVLRCGGAKRRDSVLNGLKAIGDKVGAEDWVLVHDAARPGITPALIDKLIAEVGNDAVGGLLALPVTDTLKREENDKVTTVSREGLWLAQTPQMFRYATLTRALETMTSVTDEASAIEALGLTPKLVEGHVCNSKLTRPADKDLIEHFLTATKK